MSTHEWTDVVQAYEEQIEVLEAARQEYEQAAGRVIRSLAEHMAGVRSVISLPAPCEVAAPIVRREDDGCGRWIAEMQVRWGQTLGATIAAYLAAPWGGPPGTLRLYLAEGPTQWLLEEVVASKITKITGEEVAARTERVPSLAGLHCLRVVSVGLLEEGDPLATTPSLLPDLVTRASAVLETLASGIGPIREAVGAILDCWDALGQDQPAGWTLLPAKRDLQRWQGMDMGYIQLDSKDLPSVWVAVHPLRQEIVYGHGRSDRYPQLADAMAERLGCRPIVLDGSPAGVLMGPADLEKADRPAITRRCLEAFTAFRDLTA